MNILNLTNELRAEFQKRLDDALTQELRQLKLEEAEKQALAEELPGLVMPRLSAREEGQIKELIDDLDKKVLQLAELTAKIVDVACEYQSSVSQMNRLLSGKDHGLKIQHSSSRLQAMLSEIGRVIGNRLINGVLGFGPVPSESELKKQLSDYRGF